MTELYPLNRITAAIIHTGETRGDEELFNLT